MVLKLRDKQIFSWGGVRPSPLTMSATNWPIVPALDDEGGAISGMRIGRGYGSTWRKPTPVPLCPPQIPHELYGFEPGPPQWEAGN
jgi:hypothetical protein